LATATVWDIFAPGDPDNTHAEYLNIIREELNVKQAAHKSSNQTNSVPRVELDVKITPELRREGHAREVIRHVQQARKQAGLEVDDRIDLFLDTDASPLEQLLKDAELAALIKRETLAEHLHRSKGGAFSITAAIDGSKLIIGLRKTAGTA